LEQLLDEVRNCFTSDDDLPNGLLTRIDNALGTPQPAKPLSDHHRTIAKWLNEGQTGPIDRFALAHVLSATAQAQPAIGPAQNSEGGLFKREPLFATPQPVIACKRLCELCVKRGYDFCANAAVTTPLPQPARMLTTAEIFKTLTTQCINLTEACDLLQRKFCEVNNITLRQTP